MKRITLNLNQGGNEMNKLEGINKFKTYIMDAANKLQNNEFEEAFKILLESLKENPNAPEPHNLLGIWYELSGDEELARKHYRAAYALDPAYKPASENLERLCMDFENKKKSVNFGQKNELQNMERTSD